MPWLVEEGFTLPCCCDTPSRGRAFSQGGSAGAVFRRVCVCVCRCAHKCLWRLEVYTSSIHQWVVGVVPVGTLGLHWPDCQHNCIDSSSCGGPIGVNSCVPGNPSDALSSPLHLILAPVLPVPTSSRWCDLDGDGKAGERCRRSGSPSMFSGGITKTRVATGGF